MRRIQASVLFLLLGGGCSSPAVQNETASVDTLHHVPLWSQEALEAQLRVAALREQIPPDLGYKPATTPWQAARIEIPPSLAQLGIAQQPEPGRTPGSLLQQLVVALDLSQVLGREVWEQTSRIWQQGEDRATGIILQWGFKDDAVAGQDLKVQMARSDNGWYVQHLEQRLHCRRGVSADGLCL